MVIEASSGEENMRIDTQNLLEKEKLPPKRRIYNRLLPTGTPFYVPMVRKPTGNGALLHGWGVSSFSITD